MFAEYQNIEEEKQGEINITITKDDDYDLLLPLLKEGDYISSKIRWKQYDPKKPKIKKFIFVEITIKVTKITYNSDPGMKSFCVDGIVKSSEFPNQVKIGSKQTIFITDGLNFDLKKTKWTKEQIEHLQNTIKGNLPENEICTNKQQKENAEEEYHKTSNKNIDMICYGLKQALEAADNGTLSKLLITEESLKKQTTERKKDLNGKYRGANIIVFQKDDKFWAELTSIGGAVGIYRFQVE
ncbi:hypothetical protein GPJ56_006754 [Histomonas meleagridis]|uniref:uncharacterized protein n=1 Tax=Histomonas meleagridis TaxID=135588 RepID=UPI003559A370|nr:hypothetical protein GPJ56_006754 [Histomonas meleagridis]KAH0802149.1 hypothetical protein GO595_005008 [Histomonas meleagridis]